MFPFGKNRPHFLFPTNFINNNKPHSFSSLTDFADNSHSFTHKTAEKKINRRRLSILVAMDELTFYKLCQPSKFKIDHVFFTFTYLADTGF